MAVWCVAAVLGRWVGPRLWAKAQSKKAKAKLARGGARSVTMGHDERIQLCVLSIQYYNSPRDNDMSTDS